MAKRRQLAEGYVFGTTRCPASKHNEWSLMHMERTLGKLPMQYDGYEVRETVVGDPGEVIEWCTLVAAKSRKAALEHVKESSRYTGDWKKSYSVSKIDWGKIGR